MRAEPSPRPSASPARARRTSRTLSSILPTRRNPLPQSQRQLRTRPHLATAIALAAAIVATALVPVAISSGTVRVVFRAAPQPPAAGFTWAYDPAIVTALNSQPGYAGCVLDVPDFDGDGLAYGPDILAQAA